MRKHGTVDTISDYEAYQEVNSCMYNKGFAINFSRKINALTDKEKETLQKINKSVQEKLK